MIVKENDRDGRKYQVLHRFDNGYGASVVQGPYTYGGPEGLYEIGVIVWEGEKYGLTYDTPITNDVLGHVKPEDVRGYLDQIEALPEGKN